MDAEFLQARIDKCKAQIVLYENMVDSLLTGEEQSYTINTGQTVHTVTKYNLESLTRLIESLYNRCATLSARLNGATVNGKPAW